jgi:uncharacterized membrane protein HdeD (DUF308 family)
VISMVAVFGLVVLVVGVVLVATHTVSAAIALPIIVLGLVGLLAGIFRRYGRKGDFNRSGWSG